VEVPEVQTIHIKPPPQCLAACPAWPSLPKPLEGYAAAQQAGAALGVQAQAKQAYDACAAQVKCIADFEAAQ
jgi:hypothetical protein